MSDQPIWEQRWHPLREEWVLYTERAAELRDINSVCQSYRVTCDFPEPAVPTAS